MLPSPIIDWLTEQSLGAVTGIHPVGGGCINNGARIVTASGQSFFLKTNAHCPPDMFAREAEGLETLAVADGPRVPRVFLIGADFLLIEDLHPARQSVHYWSEMGYQLALLHAHTSPQFGFSHDNYIGSTPQPNPWTDDGFAFFAQHRLMFQAELAGHQHLLSSGEVQQVGRLSARLQEYIPPQPASLIHGDLWSGNLLTDENGAPALIDPAAHYGWAEADLAMMTLFGAPPEAFFRAYTEARPLPTGWRARFPLYNLYHLLNHLNLFGRGYYGQVMSIIRQWG